MCLSFPPSAFPRLIFPLHRIRVEGHTDSHGASAANLARSTRRAQAVREALVFRGVPTRRLRAVGQGESLPIESNRTAAGRATNRRIEFYVEGDEAP